MPQESPLDTVNKAIVELREKGVDEAMITSLTLIAAVMEQQKLMSENMKKLLERVSALEAKFVMPPKL